MSQQSLLDIKREPVDKVLAGLLAKDDPRESIRAGTSLVKKASEFGLDLRDYLTLAISTEHPESQMKGLSGYEAALAFLRLPIRDDFKHGVVLQAASDTFQTYPGTRALFPPVIDDVLRWTHRQDQIQSVDQMLAGSRTMTGNELLFTVMDDTAAGEEFRSFTVGEFGRFPVRTIRTSEQSVRMYKHGSAIRTSYEFNRRARLDMLTPFAARVARELELAKLNAATAIMINGDLSNTAAPVVEQKDYTALVGTAGTGGLISYKHLLAWLVDRAKKGAPVDTVMGNFDALYQWMALFAPLANSGPSAAQVLQMQTGQTISMPMNRMFPGNVNFVISSAMPANQILGFTKAETLEELREAGGDVAEQERAMLNQSITYIRSEVTGYRLMFKDTREIYDFAANG